MDGMGVERWKVSRFFKKVSKDDMNGSWVDEIDVDFFVGTYNLIFYIYKRQYSLDLVLMPLRLAFQGD